MVFSKHASYYNARCGNTTKLKLCFKDTQLLGYLVTMTRPDLAWSYSELSKHVQFPGIAHMEAAEHVLQYLRDTWNDSITYTRGSQNPNEL